MYGSPVGKPPVTAYTSVGVCAQISDYMLPLHKAHLVLSVCVCVFVQKYELQFIECWKYNVRVCFSVHKGVCVCVCLCVCGCVCVRIQQFTCLSILSARPMRASLVQQQPAGRRRRRRRRRRRKSARSAGKEEEEEEGK